MIRRVKIRGYKSLREVDVQLEPLTVLIGKNAAGKSNFQDALQLLTAFTRARTLAEAFAPPYRGAPLESFSFGADGIKGLLALDSARFSIEVDVKLSPQTIDKVNEQISQMRGYENGPVKSQSAVREHYLRYGLEIEILPKAGFLRVANEYLQALTPSDEPNKKRNPFLELDPNKKQLRLRMEKQAHPIYHDRYLNHTILSTALYAPHYPHITALKEEIANWHFFYFEPREHMRARNPVREVRHIGLMGENLAAFLNSLRSRDALQYKAIQKAIHLLIPSISGLETEINDLGEVELKVVEGGTAVPASILSEGTLRMIGLLTLVGTKESPTLIGFEEPENGIHPHRIQLVAELLNTRRIIGGTQIIVTTHSPILLNYLPLDSLFECSRTDGSTRIRPVRERAPLLKALEAGEPDAMPISERLMRGGSWCLTSYFFARMLLMKLSSLRSSNE